MKLIKLCLFLLPLFIFGCNDSQQNSDIEKATKHSPKSATFEKPDRSSFDLEKQRSDFAQTEFKVLDISESEYDKTPALAISFSVPIEATVNINQFLTVTSKNGEKAVGAWILNQSQTRAYFPYVESLTTYSVEVSQETPSITGGRLDAAVTQEVRTSRLEPSVKFTSKGRILPLDLTSGLAIESVNIDEVDIKFHRVNKAQISNVLSQRLEGYLYQLESLSNYTQLAYTARYQLETQLNKRVTTNIPVHHIPALKEPGIYIAVMQAAGQYSYDYEVISFYVSNLALHTRQFAQGIDVHALSIKNGQSQSGVTLEVLSRKGNQLAQTITDKSGNARLASWDNDAVILATKNQDFALISLAEPALDLSEQISENRKQKQQEVLIYGPRDLYRPGEKVQINALLRGPDGETLSAAPLAAKLYRPDGRLVRDFSWQPKVVGFYEYEFETSRSMLTGEWRFNVTYPGGDRFEYLFSIEEFLPERMRLSLTSSLEDVDDANKNLTISGQGDYLYGAPAAGNRISANFKIKPVHHPLTMLKDFYFGSAKSDSYGRAESLDDAKLSETGKVDWLIPNLWQSEEYPTQLVFEASLFESGGRPVTRRVKQIFWPEGNQIGVRRLSNEAYQKPYSEVDFEIISTDKNGNLSELPEFEVTLIREDSRYFWRANGNSWNYSSNQKDKKVYSRTIQPKSERESLSVPVEYGTYRFEIKDSSGKLKNSYRFFSGWSWDDSGESSISGARPDRIRVQFDKETYKAGDVAKVKLISPFVGNALIRVESNQVNWEKQIKLSQVENEFEVPISADWKRHDLYLTAMVIAPAEKISSEIQLPKRAFGLAPLRLDRSERMIDIEIDSPSLIAPMQTVEIKVKANTKSQAKGVPVYLTLAAVDSGVLSLSNYQMPKPHEWFYGQRTYSGNIRDSFSQLIKNQKGSSGVLKFGGDAELTRGGEQAANEVQIVSFFSGLVTLDSNNEGVVSLELPDFNGELQLMAIAFSEEKFGHAQNAMTVRSPVVAEISKPRFLALSDKTTIALDVQNLTGMEQEFNIAVSTKDAIQSIDKLWNNKLADGEKVTHKLLITAAKLGQGEIEIVISDKAGQVLIKRDWKIGVRSAYPAEFKRQRKVLQSGETFSFKQSEISELLADTVNAKVEYSSIPPLNGASHLEGLFQYPYGCLEQTSSRAWPLVNFSDYVDGMKLDAGAKKVIAEKEKHIAQAIQRVSGMQRSDGSFGLWNNQSAENHWLTAYAIEFLINARSKGYAVPSKVIDGGLEKLHQYVRSLNPSYSERRNWSEAPKHFGLAYRAYAAYVLAKNGKLKLSELRQLSQRFAKETHSGLPLAHLAASYEMLGDPNTSNSFWTRALAFRDYQTKYLGDYGSRIRDMAWVMNLAAKSVLDVDYIDLIYQINDALLEKRWFSTQEKMALFNLSQTISTLEGEAWVLNVNNKKNEKTIIEGTKNIVALIDAKVFENETNVSLEKGDTLFVDLQMVGYPKAQPKPISNGIDVRRSYYHLDGKARNLNQVKSGDYVLVRIDAIANQRMPEALLVDFLPAGFELENPNLEYSYSYSEIEVEGYSVSRWSNSANVKHEEYRDDRFVAALDLNKNRWSTLFYLMRAVTPGEYQVPPTLVEDMYRPELRAVGKTILPVKVLPR